MSRFNSEAYDKVFPQVEDPTPTPESAVETFTPSQDKIKDPSSVKVETVIPEVEGEEDPGMPEDPEGGVEDGHAEHSKSDSE